jgi:hypothetical protein
MPKVLTAQANMQCSHGGMITIPATQSLLTIGGNAVLVKGDEGSATVSASCGNKGPNLKQCTKIALTNGAATKLQVGGKAVLLQSVAGTTDSTPVAGTWNATDAGQTKLDAV